MGWVMFNNKLFKKVFLCVVFFTSIFTVLADVEVVSGLKGTYSWLPLAKKIYSPLYGVVMVENGELKKLYNQKDKVGDVARIMFHELDGKMRITAHKGNPVHDLDFHLLKGFIEHLDTEKPFTELRNNGKVLSSFALDWKERFGGKKDNFNGESNKFIKALDAVLTESNDKEKDKALLRNMFLAFVYLRSETNEDLKNFLAQFFSEEEKQEAEYRENMSFDNIFAQEDKNTLVALLNEKIVSKEEFEDNKESIVYLLAFLSSGLYGFLKISQLNVSYEGHSFANCGEAVLQTLVNIILYDYKKQELSLKLLPESIDPLEGLKSFIQTYNKPQKSIIVDGKKTSYSAATKDAWVDLVSSVPSVAYHKHNSEMHTSKNSYIHLLAYLFGIKPTPQNFNEIGEKLSQGDRKIVLSDMGTEYGRFSLEVIAKGHTSKVTSLLEERHASCALGSDERTGLVTYGYKNLMNYAKTMGVSLSQILDLKELAKNNKEVLALLIDPHADIDLLNLFIDNGVNLEFKFNRNIRQKAETKTFLDQVVEKSDNVAVVKLLLEKHAKINSLTLKRAIQKGNKEIVMLLLDYSRKGSGVDLPFEDILNDALENVLELHNQELFNELCEAYKIVRTKLFFLVSVIDWEKDQKIFDILINSGADVNAQNKDGNTPLMYLLNFNSTKKGVELLLNAGARVTIKNKDGQTALDRAIKGDGGEFNSIEENLEIVKIIEEALKKQTALLQVEQ